MTATGCSHTQIGLKNVKEIYSFKHNCLKLQTQLNTSAIAKKVQKPFDSWASLKNQPLGNPFIGYQIAVN